MTEAVPMLFDREAEQSVLGAVMLDARTVWEVGDKVQPADFYEPKHDVIAQAIFALANEGKPGDVIAVTDELYRRGELRGNLDAAYLHDLTRATPTHINAGYWAGIVAEKAILRRLTNAGTSIAQLPGTVEGSPEELVERAREAVDAVASGGKSQVRAIGESFDSFVNALEEKPRYVPTPWWELNDLIGGFRSGGLYIIGARPAQGKSIMGLNAAVRLAGAGPVAYCSLEMSKEDITARLLAQIGQIHLSPLMNHMMSERIWQQVAMAKHQIHDMPLFVSTGDEVGTLNQIRSFARSVSRKASKDKPMAGLVVDYLQLMSSDGRVESRQVEVAGFSRALKMLAADLNIPIIALSQLNRQVEGRKNGQPTMADLRESGSIEQDADVVMLLHHDEKHTPNDLSVIVPKNRHGKTGEIKLAWEGQFSRALSHTWTPTSLLDEEN